LKYVNFKEVKAKVTLTQVLEHYGLLAAMKQSKEGFEGQCPFCQSESKRSLKINTDKSIFKCFAPGCQAKGNVLDFVARMEKTTVRGAALKLTSWFNLPTAKGSSREQRAPTQADDTVIKKTESDLTPYFQTLWDYLEAADAPLAQYEALEVLQTALM
jgi:DNA primase